MTESNSTLDLSNEDYDEAICLLSQLKAHLDIFTMFLNHYDFGHEVGFYQHTLSSWSCSLINQVDAVRGILDPGSKDEAAVVPLRAVPKDNGGAS